MKIYGSPSAQQVEKRAAAMEALHGVLTRLEGVLKEENAVLESRRAARHDTFIARKNQILRDLMVIQRADAETVLTPESVVRLRHVRTLVDRNHGLLQSQVQAMSEITSLLTEVALAEDADGTYSRDQQ